MNLTIPGGRLAHVLAVAFFNSNEEGKNFWPLLEPLRGQDHQITLLTNQDFIPPKNKDIEVWGLLEKASGKDALKLLAPLLSKKFDIVHFFHFQETPSLVHHLLFWYFMQKSQVVMASSLMTDKAVINKSGLLKLWLQNSDIVTGFSRSTLAEMRTIRPRSQRQNKISLPPLLNTMPTISDNHWSRADEELLEEITKKDRLLVPYFPASLRRKDSFWTAFKNLLKNQSAVFAGSQKDWSLTDRKKFSSWLKKNEISTEWILSGENQSDFQSALVANTKTLWLAGLPLSSFEVVYWLSVAFAHNKPVVVDALQSRLYPELLRSNVEWCLILSSNPNDWPKDWNKRIDDLSTPPDWMEIQHHTDAKVNDLSRVYQRALEDRPEIRPEVKS